MLVKVQYIASRAAIAAGSYWRFLARRVEGAIALRQVLVKIRYWTAVPYSELGGSCKTKLFRPPRVLDLQCKEFELARDAD